MLVYNPFTIDENMGMVNAMCHGDGIGIMMAMEKGITNVMKGMVLK